MDVAIYECSDNHQVPLHNEKKHNLSYTSNSKTKQRMNARTPLSSINRNAQNARSASRYSKVGKGVGDGVEKMGIAMKKISINILSSVGKKRGDNKVGIGRKPSVNLRKEQIHQEDIGVGVSHEHGSLIFRKRNTVSNSAGFEAILKHANPIHERIKVVIHEDAALSIPTSELFDNHRVVDGIVHTGVPNKNLKLMSNKSRNGSSSKGFLEAPNEDFFTEEMDLMLNLQLANPIDESDTESEVSQEFS